MNKTTFKTVSKKRIADTVTPVGLYLRFRDKYANTLLLESSDYHSKEESFSFIAIDPLLTMKVENHDFIVSKQGNVIEKNKIDKKDTNFYSLFNDFSKSINLDCDPTLKSFNGLYGYSTYDSVQYFENIALNVQDAPSKIPLMQYSFYRFIIAINHFNDEMTILENVEAGGESRISEIETIIEAQTFNTQKFEITGEETSNCTNDDFKQYVVKAKAHCKRGDVFQLVLSRQFQQKFKGDEFNVYRALRSINPSPYLFYFDYGSFKLMGSSPEAQIKISEGKAIINPIAGTFRRTGDMAQDIKLGKKLSEDKKETAEHVMLVDLARNDLSKHANNVKVEVFKEVQYFSHVIHLVSTVKGEIKGDPIEIVGDTFPAGTLSGAPKYKAMQLIDTYENQSRGFYGGAVGIIGLDGSVNLAIAIRSFVSKNNVLYYQAGAGIVIHSDQEKELQEVNNKLAALKKALILAENI
ncbi:anthranilate synthase component I family protein [Tenacibaculum finnmarkense]|uniref:anthranilate synthase component I family protein n=1 Tax=Tenacibaculum finnmarkense TaxID=2781243 RepID=UPI001E4BA022|nr:anthranilate synthase component I family protein [Tenacibaculum finnmarkense]MCD8413170.1 anthranilate synthase component I family protein [Tenacibaculum finnmarkense genomovar ulcerans]MCG8207453.1 anthranilate synthase component I family protein [Tenacibaculum finnmarkense genomovar finnmarkense]MCG8723564.1 anthranilate synthase component I family protein [Tenacibaculum finnmarkense]MCG8765236.1 anthranilate synthase component I family protein [Tenacibaculum finnmarkense]MCG8778054.1 ant